MSIEFKKAYSKVLESIAIELDIPPSKYQQAVQRYTSVGRWLSEGEYEGVNADVHIYTQGSFRLGTVVRPIKSGNEADYDIDLVCELALDKDKTRPNNIKQAIGERLKAHEVYQDMLDKEKKRCWTLNYAEQDGIGFHLDVLPAIPQSETNISKLITLGVPDSIACKSICITNKEKDDSYTWASSNPNGYARWFDSIKQPVLEKIIFEQKQRIFESNRSIFNQIDEVPDQLVKTPLQRTIQILKRHRDIRFSGHEWEDCKPISMIITTLCAKLYQQEEDIFSTIKNVTEKLISLSPLLNNKSELIDEATRYQLIHRKEDGTWVITNPVNPEENFADRWHENNNRRANLFFHWVEWLKNDLVDILESQNASKVTESLKQNFGEGILKKATKDGWSTMLEVAATDVSVPHIDIKNPIKPWSQ